MKRFVTFAVVLLLVAGVGWSVAWFYVANEVEAAVAALADADGITAPRLTCGTLAVEGFPFRLDVDCDGAELLSQDVTYSLPAVAVRYSVFRPNAASVSADAPMAIVDAFTGSHQRLDFSELTAAVQLAGWRVGHVSIDAADLRLLSVLGGEQLIAEVASADIDLLDISEAHDPEAGTAAIAAVAELSGATAPGIALEEAASTLQAEVYGLPDDIRRFADPGLAASLAARGAELRLVELSGADVQGQIESSGTITLDEQSLPQGQINVVSTGVVERIRPYLPPEWQALILGGAAPDGSYRQTLSLRNGVVFSGLIPIATLPPLF